MSGQKDLTSPCMFLEPFASIEVYVKWCTTYRTISFKRKL